MGIGTCKSAGSTRDLLLFGFEPSVQQRIQSIVFLGRFLLLGNCSSCCFSGCRLFLPLWIVRIKVFHVHWKASDRIGARRMLCHHVLVKKRRPRIHHETLFTELTDKGLGISSMAVQTQKVRMVHVRGTKT